MNTMRVRISKLWIQSTPQVERLNRVCGYNTSINTIIITCAYTAIAYSHRSIEPLGATLTLSYDSSVHPMLKFTLSQHHDKLSVKWFNLLILSTAVQGRLIEKILKRKFVIK